MSNSASSRRRILDPLPQSVLQQLVADLPGPKDETASARAARFEAQLREVLSYNPRNSAEAMLATHCVLLRVMAEQARNEASPDLAQVKKSLRQVRQCDKLLVATQRRLQDFQAQPLGPLDPELFARLGLGQFLISDQCTDQNDVGAFSSIIAPLHPAPKRLQ